MAKTGRAPKLLSVQPQGPVTDARQPVAVEAVLTWQLPDSSHDRHPGEAWALAWTRTEVLVAARAGSVGLICWVSAQDVRRRTARR